MLLMSLGGTAPIGSDNGILIARGTLGDVLSEQLASEQSADADTQIGVTFQNQDGVICRTFVGGVFLAEVAGLACYESGDWRIRALAPVEEPTSGPYQRASATMPTLLRESVAAMMAGMPFDVDQERAARDAGWLTR
jgi:hypothetical protein